jgi:hypothetical protein
MGSHRYWPWQKLMSRTNAKVYVGITQNGTDHKLCGSRADLRCGACFDCTWPGSLLLGHLNFGTRATVQVRGIGTAQDCGVAASECSGSAGSCAGAGSASYGEHWRDRVAGRCNHCGAVALKIRVRVKSSSSDIGPYRQ